jgi:hypothetical protein
MGDQFLIKVTSGTNPIVDSSIVSGSASNNEKWLWIMLYGLTAIDNVEHQDSGRWYNTDGITKLALIPPTCSKLTLNGFKYSPQADSLDMSDDGNFFGCLCEKALCTGETAFGSSKNDDWAMNFEGEQDAICDAQADTDNMLDNSAGTFTYWDSPNRYCTGIHLSFYQKADAAIRAAVADFRFGVAKNVLEERRARASRATASQLRATSRKLLNEESDAYDASSLPACPSLVRGAYTHEDSELDCAQCKDGKAHVRHCKCTTAPCCQTVDPVTSTCGGGNDAYPADVHTFKIVMQGPNGSSSDTLIDSMKITYDAYMTQRLSVLQR